MDTYKHVPIIPCPFCKGHATPRVNKKDTAYCHGFIEVYIKCDTCGAKGPPFNDFHKNDDVPTMANKAVEAWNMRRGEHNG